MLDKATAAIRFGPDRKSVRAELSAHLEDKALDLQRIFPDMTREEAQGRAVSDMGDPMEVGKELAKVHKPWLGWLWRASQVLLAAPLVWLFFFGPQWGWLADWLDWFDDGSHSVVVEEETGVRIPFSCGETVQVGPYTLQAEGALVINPSAAWDAGYFLVTWHAWSPFFWEMPVRSVYWQAEDDQGNEYPSYHQWSVFGRLGTQREQIVYDWPGIAPVWAGRGRSRWRAVPQDAQVGAPHSGHRGETHHRFAGAGGGDIMDRKKRKPLSRGGKTVRNLLLAALAGVLVWINAGAPLPPEQEFQRLVQTNFLEDEVQFLGDFETSGLHWGAGLTDQWLVLGALDRGRMELWPREGDGPVVAPAPDDFARWSEIAS